MEWKAVETMEEQEVGCMESTAGLAPSGYEDGGGGGMRWAEGEPAIQMTELKEAWVNLYSTSCL